MLEDNFVARIYTSYDSEGQFLGNIVYTPLYMIYHLVFNFGNLNENLKNLFFSLQIVAFYTVLNCYVYVLAYVYSPTSTQLKSNRLMKDNPTFSMVNESDEDEDEVEDDSETGAMLRSGGPTSERTGKHEISTICYFMCFHRFKG